jgi:hypothetical protein
VRTITIVGTDGTEIVQQADGHVANAIMNNAIFSGVPFVIRDNTFVFDEDRPIRGRYVVP